MAALKNVSNWLPVVTGFPNISTNSSSLEILTTEDTGPFWKAPAIAPILVATAGTTLVFFHLLSSF